MKEKLFKIDWVLFVGMLLLITIGMFMIYSIGVGDQNQFSFVYRQIAYFLVGLVLFFVIAFINWKVLLNLSPWFYCFTIALLLITFLIGIETKGSTRWIDFKLFTLQASELVKPVLILFLVKFFNRFSAQRLRYVLVSLVLVLAPAAFVFKQPDLGSAIVILIIWVSLVYLGGIRISYLIVLGLLSAVSLPLGFNLLKSYQRERLFSFLNPTEDPLGTGYNLVQSIIAVGSGQVFGMGFGRGTQSHLNFLPEQKTDFIFATTAEELGFFGVAIILILFAILIFRILRIAMQSDSKSGSLLCYGVVSVFITQLFINAGMNMGLLPITGITLPLISYGGSSLISMMMLLGLVESVKIHTS